MPDDIKTPETKSSESKAPAPTAGAFDPFANFRTEMNRLMDGFFGSRGRSLWPTSWPTMPDLRETGINLVPEVDVDESDDAITVTVELPGMDEKDIEVTLQDGVLTLKGEKKTEKTDAAKHLTERHYGSFRRSFRLPDAIDEEKVTAEVAKGVLTVVVPKTEAAAPTARKIPVGNKA